MRKFFQLYSTRIDRLSLTIVLFSFILLFSFFRIQVIDNVEIKNIVQTVYTVKILKNLNSKEKVKNTFGPVFLHGKEVSPKTNFPVQPLNSTTMERSIYKTITRTVR